MIRTEKLIFFLLVFLVVSCNQNETVSRSADALKEIIVSFDEHNKQYDKEAYPLGIFTKAYFKGEADFAKTKIEELSKIKKEDLSETDKISADLLAYVLQDRIDYYEFEQYLNPLLSDAGFHSNLTYRVRPLTNYKQVKDYLKTLHAIPEFVDQHLAILREGIEKGVVQPAVIFKGYESTYNDHIVSDYKSSFYYKPFTNLPGELTEVQRDSVLAAAQTAIETVVVPQFQRIKLFFETEYLPNTRKTLGIYEIPNGKALYQNRINHYTTSTKYTS